MDREDIIRMAREALDSDNPDIQLRAAIALRQALEEKQEPVARATIAKATGEKA